MVALKRSTVKSIADSTTANKDIISFVSGSKTMPQGGNPNGLSIAKLNQFGFNLDSNIALFNEVDETTFNGVTVLVDEFNAKGHTAEIVGIEKTAVANYDERGKRTEETSDAVMVKTIVTVKDGSEVKDIPLNIVLRSKSTALGFLQSFKLGETGILQITTANIQGKPNIWARVM